MTWIPLTWMLPGAAFVFLILVLVLGRFDLGSDWSGGLEVTRADNPKGYWIAIAALAAFVIVTSLMIAAHYGVDLGVLKIKSSG